MEKWKITITDNETGEIESHDTNAIFLVTDNEKGTWNSFRTSCNGLELCSLFSGVIELLEQAKNKHSGLWEIAEGFVAFKKNMEGEQDGDII